MTIRPFPADGRALSTCSTTYIPHGTPVRHQLDATAPEIRLIIGAQDSVELSMDLPAAGQIVTALQIAVREHRAIYGDSPAGPDAA